MSDVTIRNVRKSYGVVDVLHGIEIEIAHGEFIALVGPSGCGKSTLLRMIAGLEDITSGTVEIGGQTVNALPARERDIAMVFQNYALYPHLDVRQNLAFSLKIRGLDAHEIAQRVKSAAIMLNLDTLLDRYPRQLSGGQRQRVAMGRAIVRDPKVFLFDEPLSNLDAKLRVQMRTEIKQLHQRLGATMIYVTHDQIEAMTMADRIVVMRNGLVQQIGAPLDLYDRPASTFVAQFIGSPAMNLIQGTVSNGKFDGNDGLSWPLDASALSLGEVAALGVRPEHVILGGDGPEFTVDVVEPTGQDTIVSLSIGVHKLTVSLRERPGIRTGDRVRLGIDWTHAHLFDAKGLRLM